MLRLWEVLAALVVSFKREAVRCGCMFFEIVQMGPSVHGILLSASLYLV